VSLSGSFLCTRHHIQSTLASLHWTSSQCLM
jgi:hypothetical protein